jgi:hypothetical protein
MRRSVLACLVFVSGAAAADERLSVEQAQAHDPPLECYCRAAGKIFLEGESICLRTADGPKLARCEMVTNVMSWGMTERPCPES